MCFFYNFKLTQGKKVQDKSRHPINLVGVALAHIATSLHNTGSKHYRRDETNAVQAALLALYCLRHPISLNKLVWPMWDFIFATNQITSLEQE